MNKIILSLILLFSFNYAKKLTFNANDISIIKKSRDTIKIINRIKMYKKLSKKIIHYSLIKKLSHINSFYNKILPSLDIDLYNKEDYWATRKEFLINGKGDCEDYVIAKYFSLLEVGIKKEKLYFSVVKVKGAKNEHMVLLYVHNIKQTPLVLDNLSFKVLALNKRKDLKTKFIFNEQNSYLLKNYLLNKKVKIKWKNDNKWKTLLTRVYDKNE
ncbi:MAG: transglutaminase-like cysteine peptidase [Campylobacterales bacterium]|nr:transglutaminase-like cysteine peptidase [Campylobacterales bacterium]